MQKLLSSFSVSLLFLLLISCDNPEEEIADTAAPKITVTPPAGKSVSGTVNIAAVLEDLSTELSVVIKLDGVVVEEGTSTSIDFQLDTRTLSDGAHTVLIIATDAAGNASQFEIPILVRNTLLIIDVPANYVEAESQVYFIISRNDGSLIAYEKAQNGSSITIPTPDTFNPDSSFVVTEYLHSEYPWYISTIDVANVYAGVQAGHFRLPEPAAIRQSVGMHHFEVSDIPNGHNVIGGAHLTSSSGWASEAGGGESSRVIDLGMFNQTSDMFFYADQGNGTRPVFLSLPQINPGEETVFSAAGLPQMNDHHVTLREPASYYSVQITGYRDELKYGVDVYSDNLEKEVSSVPSFYPCATYPKYHSSIAVQSAGILYTHVTVDPTPPSTFEYINARPSRIAYVNNKFTMNATGDYDFGTAAAVQYNYGPTSATIAGYYVTVPNCRTNAMMPEIPQLILDMGLPATAGLVFDQVSLYDIHEVKSIDDYCAKVVFSSDGLFRRMRPQVSMGSAITQDPGGRKSARLNIPESLKATLDRHLLMQ